MSNLVRGLTSRIRARSFSLRSAREKFRVNSSFAYGQGGFVDNVND
jgi:hypothetical protein